jgi:hypothetical protein
VSAITTSTDTTAGVGGVKLTNGTGDGKDFEGASLGSMSDQISILIRCPSSGVSALMAGEFDIASIADGGFVHIGTNIPTASMVLTALSSGAEVEVTIFAQ